MTPNNYPEGLDELAVKVWNDKPGHIASYEFIKDNARPQLDSLHRRRVFEGGFDRGYDAAMEASNGNA